ncbi:MAG: Mut7-C RNAse domain-containing protein [Anaerolineales bacterium]|jgi:uncharacterized protein with PIN domain
MKLASFRFYAELNDFLPQAQRHVRFQHPFLGNPGIKDVIEALGPPHTEIDLIFVNGVSVGFEHALQGGDRVSVYPRFRELDISVLYNLRPPALDPIRFVLDMHLGRLAAYLRMLGFDCLYWTDAADDRLAQVSHDQRRVLLTRDRGLLKRSIVTYGYWVRHTQPRAQLREVVDHYQLRDAVHPFSRCMRCNGILEPVEKRAVAARLPAGVRNNYDRFRICLECGRIYWRGSHYERMQGLIGNVLDRS